MRGDLWIRGGDVEVAIAAGSVVDAAPPGAPVLDASGCVVVPGFVDLQCNGGWGIDLLSSPERLWDLAALLPATGVTAWLPTIVTSAPEIVDRALAAVAAGPPDGVGVHARPLGLHLEGPFLARLGAHDARYVRIVDDDGWSRDGGVRLVTLAPELPGARELARSLAARGVVVSMGHSDATAEQALAAIDAGARFVTHLFNAMAPLHHREPGLAGVALADERVHVGVIADGVHVHPVAVTAAHRALRDRLVLVTDAVAALGSGADASRLPDGTLAGSTLTMERAVRNLAAWTSTPLADAARHASVAPAAVLGDDRRGHLRPGAHGDAVVLTADGDVVATVVAGELVRR